MLFKSLHSLVFTAPPRCRVLILSPRRLPTFPRAKMGILKRGRGGPGSRRAPGTWKTHGYSPGSVTAGPAAVCQGQRVLLGTVLVVPVPVGLAGASQAAGRRCKVPVRVEPRWVWSGGTRAGSRRDGKGRDTGWLRPSRAALVAATSLRHRLRWDEPRPPGLALRVPRLPGVILAPQEEGCRSAPVPLSPRARAPWLGAGAGGCPGACPSGGRALAEGLLCKP